MLKRETKSVLGNGVRVVTLHVPHVRSVSMGIWVNAGARDETPAESGLCHLIEHMLFKGTRRRTAFQIAKAFDAIGGQTNAFTTMETTCCHARVMDAHLDTMVDVLCDLFLNASFDPEEYERERPVILQEIGMMEDSPDDFVHVLLEQAFWGDQPLGKSVLGTRENLLRYDTDTLKSFFNKFNQPERIVISAAGNINHDRLVALVGPIFEAITKGPGLPDRLPATGRQAVRFVPKDLEQTHIGIALKGLSVTDPRRYALNLLNTVLGGNMSSRLFQEIREKRGLAYCVYTFLSCHADTGMCGAYAAVSPDKAAETVHLIARELRALRSAALDRETLREAKEYLKGGLLLAAESTDNQMARLAQNEINLGRFISEQEILDAVEAVDADAVRQLADTLFRQTPSALAVLGTVPDETAVREAFAL